MSGKGCLKQDTHEEAHSTHSATANASFVPTATVVQQRRNPSNVKSRKRHRQLSVFFAPSRSTHRSTRHPTGQSGIGAVYGYDAVGSFERVRVACAGGGLSLMQPVLDRLDAAEAASGAGGGGRAGRQRPVVAVGLEEALALVRRAFVAGGERDISLGDEVEIVVVTRKGHRRERLQLKSH